MCHRADSPSRDFVAAIGLRTRIQPNDGGAVLCSSRVLTPLRYTCATGHLGMGLLVAQSVTVRAVTPDHSDVPHAVSRPTQGIRRGGGGHHACSRCATTAVWRARRQGRLNP